METYTYTCTCGAELHFTAEDVRTDLGEEYVVCLQCISLILWDDVTNAPEVNHEEDV